MTDDLLDRAERAFADGDLDTAEGLLRTAVSEGAPRRAVKLLARVIEKRAREADRNLDPDDPRREESLGLFEEAYRLHPERKRHQHSFAKALRQALARALLAGEFERARSLVDSDVVRNARDRRVRKLAVPELRRLLEALPIAELMPGDTALSGRTLMILETGVEPYLLPAYLPALGAVDVYSEAGIRDSVASTVRLHVTPLVRAGGATFGLDAKLSGPADQVSATLREELRRALPADLTVGGGLDILETMAFQFDEVVLRAAKRVTALHTLLADPRYESVVLVLGNGALHRCIADELMEKSDDRPHYFLWCSRTHDRYGVRVASSAPQAVPPRRREPRASDRTRRPPATRLRAAAGRVRRLAGRLLRERSRAAQETREAAPEPAQWPGSRCALVASPIPLHVGSVSAIASRLPASWQVLSISLDEGSRFAEGHEMYEALVAERPTTVLDVSPASAADNVDAAPERRLGEALDALVSSERLADLRVDDIRVGPTLEAVLPTMLEKRLPADRAFVETLSRRLDAAPPDVILVSPDRFTRTRAACLLARERGIPTVFPQVLFFSPSPRYKPLQADYVCVLDDHHRDLFTEHFRADPEQVVVTGIPRFDRLLELREQATTRSLGQGEQGVVLLALQSLGTDFNDALVDALLDAVDPLDAELVVKLHPHDRASNEERYREIVEQRLGPDRGQVHWKTDIYDLVLAADVVVSAFSNVIFESAVLDRLTICANFTDEPLPVPFVEQGLAVGCSTPEELADSVRRMLDDAEFREEALRRRAPYFARNPHLLDGPAADRVADFVDGLVGGRSSG